MVGSRYPFRDRERDPNRRVDDTAGNRRDDTAGNRREEPAGNRRDDTPAGPRPDRPRDAALNNRPRRPDRRPDDAPDSAAGSPPGPPAPPPMPPPPPPLSSGAAELAALSGEVEALIRLITATDVNELQLESGGLKILIRRGPPTGAAATPAPLLLVPPASAALSAAPPSVALPMPAAHLPAMPGHGGNPATPTLAPGEHLLTSPMVGTFYASPAPQEAPYVVEGDEVAVGQTVGIVEAMKMMNPIEAEVGGRVARILVRDAQGVEYGQPLIVIAEG